MPIFRKNYIIYHNSFGYGIVTNVRFLDDDQEIAIYFNKDKKRRFFSKNALLSRIDFSKSENLILSDIVDLFFVNQIFDDVDTDAISSLKESSSIEDFRFADKEMSASINGEEARVSLDKGFLSYEGQEKYCFLLFDLLMHSLETTFDKEQEQILSLIKEVEQASEQYPQKGIMLIRNAIDSCDDYLSVITNKGVFEKYQRGIKPLILCDAFIDAIKEKDPIKAETLINKHNEAKTLVSNLERDIGLNKINTIPYYFFNDNYYLVIKAFERETSEDMIPFIIESIKNWNNDERLLVQLLSGCKNESIIKETYQSLKDESIHALFMINHSQILKRLGLNVSDISYDLFIDCLNKSDPLNRLEIVLDNYEIFIKNHKEIKLLQEIFKSNDGFYISQTKKCIKAIEAMPHNIEIFNLFANYNFEFFNRYMREKDNG